MENNKNLYRKYPIEDKDYRKYPIEDIYFCKYQKYPIEDKDYQKYPIEDKDYKYLYRKYKSKYLSAKRKLQDQKGAGLKYDDSLWIEENFFSKKEFEEIKDYCNKLELKKDPRSDNRLSLCLNPKQHKYLYDAIYKNKKFIQFVDSIKDDDMTIKPEPTYPIEYRKYPKGSQGMPWHQDTSLFTPDAFEVVLTITNSSDSKFLWQEGGKERSINPMPNTLAIVKPSSVFHSVSSVNNGERTILKFVIEFIKNGELDNKTKPTFNSEIGMCPF